MTHSTRPDSAGGPHVWRADRHDGDAVARLLVAFRDHCLEDLFVAPEARRSGLGRALFLRLRL